MRVPRASGPGRHVEGRHRTGADGRARPADPRGTVGRTRSARHRRSRRTLLQGLTVLIADEQLALARHADRIVLVEHGAITLDADRATALADARLGVGYVTDSSSWARLLRTLPHCRNFLCRWIASVHGSAAGRRGRELVVRCDECRRLWPVTRSHLGSHWTTEADGSRHFCPACAEQLPTGSAADSV